MKFSITFNLTGDSIEFDALNPDLVSWFIEKSKQNGNNYGLGQEIIDQLVRSKNTESLIQEEIEYIEKVNSALIKLKMPTIDIPDNWHDQKQLNTLHKVWAKTRIDYPNLTKLFYTQFGKEYYSAYQEMNCHIHLIEQSYKYTFRDPSHWRLDNPFKNQFFEWQDCNIYLSYPGHGREAYEQYRYIDIYDDLYEGMVNWDNVDAKVGVLLQRPITQRMPIDFENWCKEKNIVPHRQTLPLGNVSNWQTNLTKAREIFCRNVKIEQNSFSLEII